MFFFFYNVNSALRKIKSIVTRCYIYIKITFKQIESEVTSFNFCEKYYIKNSVSHNLFYFYKIMIWLNFFKKITLKKIESNATSFILYSKLDIDKNEVDSD